MEHRKEIENKMTIQNRLKKLMCSKSEWHPKEIQNLLGECSVAERIELAQNLRYHSEEYTKHNRDLLLYLLARDGKEEVRIWAAQSIHLSREEFELLSKDPSEKVRIRIAKNYSTPDDIKNFLATDSSVNVRIAMCRRGYDDEYLGYKDILVNDKDIEVRMALAKFEGYGKYFINDEHSLVRAAAACDVELDSEDVFTLASDDDSAVRCSVAEMLEYYRYIGNDRRIDIAKKLSNDDDGKVRKKALDLLEYYKFEKETHALSEHVYLCKQNTPHHIYDVYTHTIKVVEYCKTHGAGELLLRAAYLHDVGKAKAKYNDGNFDRFTGHPEISAQIAKDLGECDYVIDLVRYHDAHRDDGIDFEKLAKKGKAWCEDLALLMIADLSAQSQTYKIGEKLAGRGIFLEKLFAAVDKNDERI